ncbi:MAG: 3-oxoacyl-ACP reductase FabG [Propioniciclava sp.]
MHASLARRAPEARYGVRVDEQISRSILITGGARGIGRALVERFLAAGDRVVSLSPSGRAPEGALGITGNVADPADVDAAFAQAEAAHGPVEVVVANAGITKDTLILRMSEADFDEVVDVNLKGAFTVAKRAAKGMLRLKRGRIILIGSVVGLYGSPGQVNYAATKAGLVGIARSLTRELGGRGITANVVAPGFIETEMTATLPEKTVDGYRAAIPAHRLGQVDEVAAAVAYLASAEAAYVSGAVLPVDGGLGMGH